MHDSRFPMNPIRSKRYDHTNYWYPLFLCFDQSPSISDTWHIQANRVDILDIPTLYRLNGKVNWFHIPYTVIPYSFSVLTPRPVARTPIELYPNAWLIRVITYDDESFLYKCGSCMDTDNECEMTEQGTGNQLTCMWLACICHVIEMDGDWTRRRKRGYR